MSRVPDPLDHLVAGGQPVQVHLEPDVLVGQAEAVEQLGVPLRLPHRRLATVAAQRAPERLGPGDLGGDDVEGWSWLAGICTASWPPGLRQATSRPSSPAWSGSQWRAALEKTTSQPPPRTRRCRPARTGGRRRPGRPPVPAWPASCPGRASRRPPGAGGAGGQVRPPRQPRSTTRPPGTGRTSDSRSAEGRGPPGGEARTAPGPRCPRVAIPSHRVTSQGQHAARYR